MISISRYRNELLTIGFALNGSEANSFFDGVLIDNEVEKKILHYPIEINEYGSELVLKDKKGKSYRFDPAETKWLSKERVSRFIAMCYGVPLVGEINLTGTSFIVLWPIENITSYTVESINEAILVFDNGVKMKYDGDDPFLNVPASNSRWLWRNNNEIHFNRARLGNRIEYQINESRLVKI
jgi:hypothetical protein